MVLLPFDSSAAGMWIGFALSLMIFSLVIRENILARMAQYILVGASTGYLLVLVIQNILRPKLFEPLIATEPIAFDLIVPLILGMGILVAGIAGTARQGQTSKSSKRSSSEAAVPQSIGMIVTTGLGRIAVMGIIGVGAANAITGAIQGTLLPQFWQATRVRSGLGQMAADWPTLGIFSAAFALFITIGTILHLYGTPKHSKRSNDQSNHYHIEDRSTLIQSNSEIGSILRFGNNPFIVGWATVGKWAIWFAAGVLFARLAASRLSLLIARIEYFISTLETTTVWQRFIEFVQSVMFTGAP